MECMGELNAWDDWKPESLPRLGVASLPTWRWPSIPMPGWLSRWIGGDDDSEGNNAVGTPNWPGGMTMVGEFGPELVRLPRAHASGATATAWRCWVRAVAAT